MSFNISLNGVYSTQRAIAVTSDNIANMRTTAFKSRDISFGEVYGGQPMQNSRTSIGNGVQLNQISQGLGTGSISVTGNALDLAVAGNAMFVVAPDQGIKPDPTKSVSEHKFTRNGSFKIDNLGYLRTNENFNVLDTDKRPLKFPTTLVSEATVYHQLANNLNDFIPNQSNLAGASVKFSTESNADTLTWRMDDNINLSEGSMSFFNNSIYYVPPKNLLNPTSAIKVGEVSSNSDGSMSLNFSNPTVKAPYQAIIERPVQKEVEVEYEVLVEKKITEYVTVEVEKEIDVKKTIFLNTYTPQLADFGDDDWKVSNERFISGQTVINGIKSYKDLTYGPNSSNADLGSDGLGFSSQISQSGNRISLQTLNGFADSYQTTKGPYFHNVKPIAIPAGGKISFDWSSEGSADAFDMLVYLYNRKSETYVEVLNQTGTNENGSYNFVAPDDGLYDLVFVGGTFDATGGEYAGASLAIENLSIDVADTEEVTVKERVKVFEVQPIERIILVPETRIRKETITSMEQEEVTFYTDLALDIDSNAMNNLGQRLTSMEAFSIRGQEAPSKSLKLELFRQDMLKASHHVELGLANVLVSSTEEVIDGFDNITVDEVGNLHAQYSAKDSRNLLIGQLGFLAPISESQVIYETSGYFSARNRENGLHVSSISSVGGGSVVQGALEQSNVDLTKQLTNLLHKQMLFQSNSKAIQAYMSANEQLQSIR